MSHRVLASTGVLATVIAVVSLAPVPIAGQAQTAAADTWTPPRTPWGEPDLQGIWTNATLTPMERPRSLADKAVLTAEEAGELEARAAERRRASDRFIPGNVGGYNQFWMDAGTKVVGNRRSSLVVDPPDGRIPWTPKGRERYELDSTKYGVGPFDSWVDLDTGERCLTDGLPLVPLQGYNMNYHIIQSPGWVAILNEMFHEYRLIPVDGRPHVSDNIGQWLGDARGRWEGDTLVVETTNFADKGHYLWRATWRAARPTLHLIERFTRVDAETLNYDFTMTDPTMFTRPWTAWIPMTTNHESRGVTAGPMFEYACHEGNYAIVNILAGVRADEASTQSG